MSEPSDSELLHRARQGDGIPFGTLVRRHDRYLYRLARSVLADDHEAEDVVQLTFIKAYTQLAQFRGEASLRTFPAKGGYPVSGGTRPATSPGSSLSLLRFSR